jgi:broad specificity phosphatase PhoE
VRMESEFSSASSFRFNDANRILHFIWSCRFVIFCHILIHLSRTPQDVMIRLDSLIDEIHALQSPNMHSESPSDVMLVAHGHILRAFVKRWLKYPMDFPLSMMLEPGGVGILSYQEHDINQPAFFIGMGFPLSKAG